MKIVWLALVASVPLSMSSCGGHGNSARAACERYIVASNNCLATAGSTTGLLDSEAYCAAYDNLSGPALDNVATMMNCSANSIEGRDCSTDEGFLDAMEAVSTCQGVDIGGDTDEDGGDTDIEPAFTPLEGLWSGRMEVVTDGCNLANIGYPGQDLDYDKDFKLQNTGDTTFNMLDDGDPVVCTLDGHEFKGERPPQSEVVDDSTTIAFISVYTGTFADPSTAQLKYESTEVECVGAGCDSWGGYYSVDWPCTTTWEGTVTAQ
jgi:hypothetical protein